jgi:hypothetical protein
MRYPILSAVLFVLAASGQTAQAGLQAVGRIMTAPLMSPEEVASAEAQVRANPEDVNLRLRLLAQYRDTAPVPPNDDPVKRSARLQHILHLVEHNPNVIDPASPLLYVPRSGRPYANDGDHETMRALLVRLAETNRANAKLVLNAVWFLFVEEKQQAEDLMRRAVEREPGNQRIAANLGFLYGMQILGLDGFAVDFAPDTSPARADAKQRAITELESSSNAAVLAGAATAIPNLAIRASRGTQVDPELFQLSSKLMAKARTLAPNDEAFRGPMPMIQYFQEAQGGFSNRVSAGAIRPVLGGTKDVDYIEEHPGTAPLAPSRIRIGGNAQKAKLTYAPEPKYTGEAAAIAGDVRFDATIAPDGTIAALTLRSGHPVLVQAAIDAVKQWRYQPTLLNGSPVEVITEIVVSFPPK